MRIRSFIGILGLIGVSVLALFHIKYRVQELQRDVTEVRRQLNQERDAIHVLKAEWAFLNQPERLRTLVRVHLLLEPIQVSQLQPWGAKIPAVPNIPESPVLVADRDGEGANKAIIAGRSVDSSSESSIQNASQDIEAESLEALSMFSTDLPDQQPIVEKANFVTPTPIPASIKNDGMANEKNTKPSLVLGNTKIVNKPSSISSQKTPMSASTRAGTSSHNIDNTAAGFLRLPPGHQASHESKR
jgi:hypothetical protein